MIAEENNMQKQIKTESVADFVARGGEIKKVSAKGPKRTYIKVIKDAALDEEIDFDALPAALKIKYGIR
jgi:hypothetical protein